MMDMEASIRKNAVMVLVPSNKGQKMKKQDYITRDIDDYWQYANAYQPVNIYRKIADKVEEFKKSKMNPTLKAIAIGKTLTKGK